MVISLMHIRAFLSIFNTCAKDVDTPLGCMLQKPIFSCSRNLPSLQLAKLMEPVIFRGQRALFQGTDYSKSNTLLELLDLGASGFIRYTAEKATGAGTL